MESQKLKTQKLKTQKLKCYILGPKSQKFPTAENTRYTVLKLIPSDCLGVPRLLRGDQEADRHDAHSAEDAAGPVRVCGGDDCGLRADV